MVQDVATITDNELISRIIDRDEAALSVLYDRYARMIYAIAFRITGDWHTAEEVMQDVFHNIWHTATTFQPHVGSCAVWVMSIARHRSIDATRSKRARARFREQPLMPSWPMNDETLPDVAAEGQLLRDTIRIALQTLPAPQRRTIELAYYHDLTCREIAEHLDEPLGTIKTRLRLGLQKLRDDFAIGKERYAFE